MRRNPGRTPVFTFLLLLGIVVPISIVLPIALNRRSVSTTGTTTGITGTTTITPGTTTGIPGNTTTTGTIVTSTGIPSTTTGIPVTTTPIIPIPADTNASFVYGQVDLYSNVGVPISASSLTFPRSVAIDPATNQNVYIADVSASRVLYYEGLNTTAVRVYGQYGSFTTSMSNIGGIGLETLNNPQSSFRVCTGLYILDTGNNRLLYYPEDSTVPSLIYGQVSDNLPNANGNTGAIRRMAFSMPESMFVDHLGQIYIADTGNNRVLRFPKDSNVADFVWGQTLYTTSTVACTATGLNQPKSVFVDTSLNVYIADSGNHRVLQYDPESATATVV